MPEKSLTPKPVLRRAIQNATGPVAFSNRVLIQFAPLSIALVLVSNPNRLDGTAIQWLALAIVGYLATLVVLLAFRATVLSADEKRPSRFTLTLVAFLIAGAVRGLSIYFVGAQLGIMPESEFWLRIVGGPLYVIGAISLLAVFNASRLRHEKTFEELEIEKAELDELRGGIRERIRLQRIDLLNRVQSVLDPVIQQLKKEMQKSSDSIALQLRDVVETVVRPLSHDVGNKAAEEVTKKVRATKETFGLTKQKIPNRLAVGNMIVPGLHLFATASLAITSNLIYFPDGYIWASIISLTAILVGYTIARLTLSNLWVPVPVAIFIYVGVAVIISILTVMLLSAFGFLVTEAVLSQFILSQLVVGLISFYMQFLRTQRGDAEQEMTRVVEDLAVLNSQLRQEVWLSRRRIAAILHGSVQATLYATAMRLAKIESPTKQDFAAVQADIAKAISKLEAGEDAESYEDTLEQIAEVWKGVLDVELPGISAGLAAKLLANEAAAACFVEVVREAVSNAAKHSKAKHVSIEVKESGKNLMAVKIRNDGEPVASKGKAGYGSSILDEVAYSWSLDNQKNFAVLSATIAL